VKDLLILVIAESKKKEQDVICSGFLFYKLNSYFKNKILFTPLLYNFSAGLFLLLSTCGIIS